MSGRPGLKVVACVSAIVLSACATAPTPLCVPPEISRAPESVGPFGTAVPRDLAESEKYERCKAEEGSVRMDEQWRREEAEAKQREAEQLRRELEQMRKPGKKRGES